MKNSSQGPVRFLLMNRTGNRDKDLNGPISIAKKIVMGLITVS